jgi:Lrp/AsnC family transcriptional regulator for asnA, asnC and gidA
LTKGIEFAAVERSAAHTLDDLEMRIIDAYRAEGRLSNAEVARLVGASDSTVRRRVDRLVERRILKFAALTDPRLLGLHVEALIGLTVEHGSLESVGRELAKRTEVRFLGLAMGAFDVLVVARFPSLEAWLAFRSSELGQLQGIQRVETFQIVKVLKRTFDWIFEEPGGLEGDQHASVAGTPRAAARARRTATGRLSTTRPAPRRRGIKKTLAT